MSFGSYARIKVMHFRTSKGLFGAERVILGLLKSSDAFRFDVGVTLISGEKEPNRDLANEIRASGLNAQEFNVRGRLDLIGIRRLRRHVREQGFHIVHCHDFKSNLYGLLSTMGTTTKRVTSFHGSTRDSLLLRIYLAFDEYLVIRFFHRIIVVSSHLRDELKRRLINLKQLTVIPNGLDLSVVDDEPDGGVGEPDLPLPPGAIIAGIVGRLLPDKGHEHLFKALRLLKDEFPNLMVLVVGGGPMSHFLKSLAVDLGLEDRIVFTGIRHDMANVYRSLDLFIMPSFREGLPIALLEAMASGVPVVATAVGGIPTVLDGGKRGRLVAAGDTQAIAREMRLLLLDRQEAAAMAFRAAAFVRAECSSEAMARQAEALYSELFEGR